VKPYNRKTGKWVDGERESEGLIVAKKVGNATGAKEPCWSCSSNDREAGRERTGTRHGVKDFTAGP